MGRGPSQLAHQNRDHSTGGKGGDRGPERLCQLTGVRVQVAKVAAFHAWNGSGGQSQAVVNRRAQRPRNQAEERSMPGGPTPEHSECKGGEQRCIHEGEDELQHIHDVVE